MKRIFARDTQHSPAFRTSALAFAFALASAGCVSVNIGGSTAQKSSGVTVSEPAAPFARMTSKQADSAWQSRTTGNTISYLSTCNDAADPTLETAFNELTSSLESPRTLRSETKTFNGREALSAEVAGLVDGVKTRVAVMIFKRNRCLYSLSFVGVEKNFDSERGRFQSFLDGFKAP